MEEIMWIARDSSGQLYVYNEKPQKGSSIWFPSVGCVTVLKSKLFPDVKWEDPEPKKIKLEIIK